MRRPGLVGVFLFSCAIGVSAPLDGGQPLAIRVGPAISPEPASLTVFTSVEPDARNRSLEVIAQSDQFFRSSQIQLEGARARRVEVFQLRNLPSGVYEVAAILSGSEGRRAQATRTVRVVPAGGR